MTFRKGRRGNGNSALEQRQAEMLRENLELLREKYGQIFLLDISEGREAAAFQKEIMERGLADGSQVQLYDSGKDNRRLKCGKEGIAIVVVIPFGKVSREKITDEIEHARQRDSIAVAAVLTGVDRAWMRIYYAWYNGRQ